MITVTAHGGMGSDMYSINGGVSQSSNVFTGLAAGTYTVSIIDSIGCVVALSPITIINPDSIIVGVIASSQVSCNNASDGMITVNPTGGTGAYTYSLNGGTAQSSNVFSGLSTGTYSIMVYDANGCTAPYGSPIIIANPTLLSATGTGSAQVSCNNASDGMITVTASGGTGVYTYTLNGTVAQSSNVFTGLGAGTYSISVFDDMGCSATISSITILNPDPITFSAFQTGISCSGIALGSVTINAHGGTPPYEYSIDGGLNFYTSNVFDTLKPQVLQIVITDANNCSTQMTDFVVTEYSPLAATVNVMSGNKCNGSSDASVQVNATGGTDTYYYMVDNSTPSTTNTISGLAAGDHTISVIDGNGCKIDVPFAIQSIAAINIDLLTVGDANCMGKQDGSIQVSVTGGVEPYTYSWSNGAVTPILTGLDAGTYTLTLTDGNGCKDEFSRTVNPGNTEEQLTINNAFSPNGDGINDLWIIKNIELYPDNTLTVVNRWGNEIYTINGYQNNWDGSQLDEGTYFYILKVKMCETDRTFKGYVTIVR